MKNKWMTAVAVLTLSASMAVAAPHGGGKFGGKRGHRGGEFGAKFAEKLNLTDAQKAQINAIHEETRARNAAFFDSVKQTHRDLRAAKDAGDTAKAEALKGTMKSQREQMKQLRDAEQQRVLSVLTPAQRMQFEQLKAERKARRGERRDHDKQ